MPNFTTNDPPRSLALERWLERTSRHGATAYSPGMEYRTRSFWLDSLINDPLTPRASLPGDVDVDVAIVGAGFTGLWTAYYLQQRDPGLRIAVVEAEIAGFGASGRNGGWCSALLAMGLDAMAKESSREAA